MTVEYYTTFRELVLFSASDDVLMLFYCLVDYIKV
jgi:hypothetical protein